VQIRAASDVRHSSTFIHPFWGEASTAGDWKIGRLMEAEARDDVATGLTGSDRARGSRAHESMRRRPPEAQSTRATEAGPLL
jgi:hypothetical protein